MKALSVSIVTVLVLAAISDRSFADTTGGGSTPAGTCYVYVNTPCSTLPLRNWFADSDNSAHDDAGRCAQRALEYKSWCESQLPAALAANIAVYSMFQLPSGKNVVGALATGDRSYLLKGNFQAAGFETPVPIPPNGGGR